MGLQTVPRRRLMRVPSLFIFDAKINFPAKMLLRAECQVPFIVANGPRSMEFEIIIDVAGLHPKNPTLIVTCQNEQRMKIFGLIKIGFGASKDANNSADADKYRTFAAILNETQERDFEHTFFIRGMDPFLESVHNIITSMEYENGLISFRILITYQATEFMEFVKRKGKLRQLTSAELWSSLNFEAYQKHELLNINSYLYPKWILYMGTKYFNRLINENSAINHTRLNYSGDIVTYALSLALQNWFREELQQNIKKMCQTIELLYILKPINMDIVIETLAIELESAIFAKWKSLDLDELVEILTLPKCPELEKLKIAVRSVIIDAHEEQFEQQYNEQSAGKRCALYRDLIFSGALDETTKPVESELEKLKLMSKKMNMVEKRVKFDHFWI
ncbi:hypothetical protein X798_02012 [Onchocerca flexuosa]|uniref:Uncharacterized protein n=1 Tax=Onchocerca flexuosa TaxID=387005 RepID=A0A238C1T0_9BILA|nr:hypothetical protein X798_02012 [Onchocerca flexuosa]